MASLNSDGTSSYYTGCYPAGAFLVADKRSLGPLVSDLRRVQLLKKSTRNVTGFDTAYTLLLPPTTEKGHKDQQQLQHHQLYISKSRTVLQQATAMAEGDNKETLDLISSLQQHITAQLGTLRAQEEVLPLVTLPPGQQAAHVAPLLSQWSRPSAEKAPTFTAVHVTGALTPECLTHYLAGAYLSSSSSSTATAAAAPPVAFVYFLRAYSRPCYTPAELTRLPPCHQELVRAGTEIPSPPVSHPQGSFSFTELFGGVGMFRAGLEAAGGTAALAVEMAAPAVTVYDANFPPGVAAGRLWAGDLTELPSYLLPRGHDLLSAGFPCQSFAKAGPALGLQAQHGQLFYEVVRALRGCQPACFLLENVANLVEVEEGRQLAEILRWLRSPLTGEEEKTPPLYEVQYQVLDGGQASPQVRRRVYFVGVRCDVARQPSTTTEKERAQYVAEVFQRAEEKLTQLRQAATATTTTGTLPSVAIPFRDKDAHATGSSPAHILYPTVQDVLLSTHAWQPSPSSPPSPVVSACYIDLPVYLRSLHLTYAQWEALARTQSFRQHPSWRVTGLRGRARTLMGSYRTSYQLYSEFVPVDTQAAEEDILAAVQHTVAAVMAAERTSPSRDDDNNNNNSNETKQVVEEETRLNASSASSSPSSNFVSPLRFFAPRECARLQGIPDSFQLHIPEEQPYFDATQPEVPKRVGSLKYLAEGSVYKLIGNAVNPIVIECIAKSLREVFVIGK
uniref:DNA (cytosine-5-)-methyltransferase n=1 Tax=Strigomonas galati TaxID=1003336 RepID=U5KMG4_9TRYP|nr:DNA (cytosine-5-)-methyltransferase [Strigomonas galati]